MPNVKVTGVIVSHCWDDDTQTDIKIRSGKFDDSGPYVSIEDDNQTIYLRPESWPEIKDQIQAMFDEHEKEYAGG